MPNFFRRFAIFIFPLILFSSISILYFGLDIITHIKTTYIGTSDDSTIIIWALAWWKHCILNGINPFFNSSVWYPYNYNLAQQDIITWGNAILCAPILFLFGPVVAYNISMLAAPALSAWTTFILLRYLTKSYWPAIFGAYFFGFSSYMIGHMLGHLMLVTVFLIPLIVLLTVKFYRNEISKLYFCFWISLCLALQFYINPEIFATTILFGLLSLLLAFLIFKNIITLKRTLIFLFLSLIITLILISPYLYLFFLPPRLDPSIFPASLALPYGSDLLQPFIPSDFFWLHISLKQYYQNATQYGMQGIINGAEYNCYFGIPLLILCALYWLELWKTKIAKFTMITMISIFICALGVTLHIFGKPFFPMPWLFMWHLPLIKFALPIRFGMYISLIVSVIVAFWLNKSKLSTSIKFALVSLSILFLIPTLNYSSRHWSQTTKIPTLISDNIYKKWLKPGDVIVILPYGSLGDSMLWQFSSNMYFSMAGGYLGYTPLEFAEDPTVQAFFQNSISLNNNLAAQPNLKMSTINFLISHHVKAIFVYQNLTTWKSFFKTIGMTPISADGVDVYLTKNMIKTDFRFDFLNWYGQESVENNYWMWSAGNSRITIYSNKASIVTITGKIISISAPKTIKIFLNQKTYSEINLSKGWAPLKIHISFKAIQNKTYTLSFISLQKPMQPAVNSRWLSFQLLNYKIAFNMRKIK